ncbi:DEAD/DEAH box helicase [Altericista sp. CCNU0014]|uniref:DEAD/DEAH box helicase n=1 Tax=Altericista sp. CCNU0014 TaxID=3082949 RepID=UPI00384E73D6
MQKNASALSLDLSTLYPFELDAFQTEAIAALDAGKSVVVVAPTGSGKTLIGEYAIARAIARGKRVLYTTPLKALSNQKLRDFREQFGIDKVGLVTGDLCINRDAPILVMTTEIFRNILYGTFTEVIETALTDVEAVVLDECHYMNDRQRGTVWEESIIYCPPDIQLIALSATIANARQLTDWIEWVHGPTQLIQSDWRPVPLQFHFGNHQGLFPLLNQQRTKLNPKLKALPSKKRAGRSRNSRGATPDPYSVIAALQERQMLPAIYFIFSRRGCDQAVLATRELKTLLSAEESTQLQIRLAQFAGLYPELAQSPILDGIRRGVAPHHAGLLPAWKALVEDLFQQGFIKVIFATETLAAGINMPARTTIISSLSKRTDLGHRLLNASEFLQMSGRAGRRGMDTLGHVVTLQTAFEGANEAAYLATMGADPLVSQFTPSYGMVLNLLQTRTLEESRALIEKSFGQYIAMQQLAPQQQAIADLEREIAELQRKAATVDLDAIQQYSKLKGRLKEEQRLLKLLEHQAEEVAFQETLQALPQFSLGTVLLLKPSGKGSAAFASERPVKAVAIEQIPSNGQFPHFLCLRQDNVWCVATCRDVLGVRLAGMKGLEALSAPKDWSFKPGHTHPGDAQTLEIAQSIPSLSSIVPPEILDQEARVDAVQAQIAAHPAHPTHKQHAIFLRLEQRIERLQTQLRDRQTKLRHQSQQRWQDFLCLVKLLRQFEALDNLQPTELGKTAALLRGENELWLALALRSGKFEALAPHHLAAACAALVAENNRADSWVRYSPGVPVQNALESLRPLRRELIQSQHREGVTLPVWLETDLIGTIEQWACGATWTELCAHTSLDEGDIVRILRRTVDVLSQIPNVPYFSTELRQNARRAVQVIDRFPINEMDAIREPVLPDDPV